MIKKIILSILLIVEISVIYCQKDEADKEFKIQFLSTKKINLNKSKSTKIVILSKSRMNYYISFDACLIKAKEIMKWEAYSSMNKVFEQEISQMKESMQKQDTINITEYKTIKIAANLVLQQELKKGRISIYDKFNHRFIKTIIKKRVKTKTTVNEVYYLIGENKPFASRLIKGWRRTPKY